MKEAKKRCDEIDTMIMDRMQTAAIALVPDFYISWKRQFRKEHVVPASTPRVLNIRAA
jgi:hypothetical protein